MLRWINGLFLQLTHLLVCLFDKAADKKRTQSVVNGAPFAIKLRTSSVSPLLEASSSLFPRSTSDMSQPPISTKSRHTMNKISNQCCHC